MSKAEKLFKEASAKENSFSWFGMSKEKNCEEAAELYVKAAAQFKQNKDFLQAGLAYEKAAECNMAANNELEANNNWRESGKCYSHGDITKAINSYRNAIQLYLNGDRFSQAARLAEEIGTIMETENKYDEAMKAYEESANYYTTENDITNANKRLEKVAIMAMKLKKYEKSIPIFEKIAKTNVDNNLLRWNVKNHLIRAGICIINKNIVNNKNSNSNSSWNDALDTLLRYQNISDLYASSREAKLLDEILEALKKVDLKEFKNAVYSFNSVNPLENWLVEQLAIMEEYLKQKRIEAPDLIHDGDGDNDDDEKNKPPNDVNIDDGWDQNDNNNNNNNNNNDNDKEEKIKVYDFNKAPPSNVNIDNAPDLMEGDDNK